MCHNNHTCHHGLDCGSIEMSDLQRCNGVTMHGCGNPMYNVYNWDHHDCVLHKPEPVAISHLCAYLSKHEAAEVYATNQAMFNLQTIVANTYTTKKEHEELTKSLNEEKEDRIYNDTLIEGAMQSHVQVLTQQIIDEYTRANAEEAKLDSKIDKEANRLDDRITDTSTKLNNKIDSESNKLNNKIDAESKKLNDKIDSESTRLETKINKNTSDINKLDDKVDSTLFAGVVYESNKAQIIFRNIKGQQIGSIDATDFIKDGMVNDVNVNGTSLNIVFNTDAGKTPIMIPISKIFDANNYYTKAAADNTFTTKPTFNQEIQRLNQADADLIGRINDLGSSITSGNSDLDNKITQVEAAVQTKADKTQLDNYYTKTQVDTAVQQAVNGVNMSNYYTKGQTDTAIQQAVNNVNVDLSGYYTKAQVDAAIQAAITGNSVDLSNYYTKAQADAKFITQ